MSSTITLVLGHPDAGTPHYCHALAAAYRAGAEAAGHKVEFWDIGTLEIPTLRSRAAWQAPPVLPFVTGVQDAIARSQHIVLIYPLWMGTLPAHLKAFLEHVFTEDFAFDITARGWAPRLRGRSGRVVITMGMPAVVYRYYFFAHSLRSLRRNVLGFAGIDPIRDSVIGRVEEARPEDRARWLERMRDYGARAI